MKYLQNGEISVVMFSARTKEGNQMVSTLYSSNPATLVGFEPGISCVFSCLCVFPFLFLLNPTLISIYVASKLKKDILIHIQIFQTFCWMFRIINKHFYCRNTFTPHSLHFGTFVTERAAKSIISLKCVFNPFYGLPGVSKIKILYLNLILDNIWAKKQPKSIMKSIIYCRTWQ